MHTITQHTALAALYRALNPGEQLIDGRSERDRLWFLSEFAGLLNFYNTNNDPQGNWKPLLLKDPVFLLASISKTSFAHYYSRYRYTCLAIDKSPATAVDYTLLAQLFGRLYDVYQPIGCWAYYMVQSIETYELKTYVTGLVQTTFSPYYWALMLMRKHLFALCREVLETPVEPSDGPTDYFATALWQQNKGIASWWETLGFSEQPPPLNPASPNDTANYRHCFEQLIKIGEDLFGFFKSIIAHSVNDFEKQSLVKSHYPDTTLLRAFVHLLRVQQRQLNGLARQHLDFYYRQLLQQNPLPAQPDKVFVCATLKTNDAVYHLPSGTGLLAGVDANKNPIVFTTVGDSILNPAIITSAATLSLMQDTSATPGLYLDSNKPIATVQYLPNGQVQSSPSFGGSPSATAQAVAMGVSFASPMLYLPEGMRTITCHFLFNKAQDTPVLQGASFYLSTAKDWLPLTVPGQATVAYTDAAGAITTTGPFAGAQLTIQLDAAQPAIQAFALNPDGYASTWPLLKILFASITSAASPAYIQSLTIDTTVTGLKNLRLFNDNGALATKGPFTPFGPMPLRNSQFIIGSNEIFSKPFTQLSLQFDWANLPSSVTNNTDNFETYYGVYNQYCQKYPVGPSQGSPAGTDNATAALAEATGWLGKLAAPLKWIGGKLKQGVQWIAHEARHIISDSAPAYTPQQPYNNGCFTVDFALLDSAGWQPFALQAPSTYPPPPLPTDPPPVISVQPYGVAQSLFRVNQANNQLTATSIFSYTAPAKTDAAPADTDTDGFVPDPNIQTGTLDFTDTTDTGFVRMSLTGPTVGFGSELYTNVVGWVATQNAMAIAKSAEWFFWNEPTLIPNANPPFAPSAGSLTAQYTASQQYDLTVQTGSYPLQCFLYGPFAQYAVYNNQPGQNIPPDQVITNVGGMPLAPDGGQEAATTETALPPSGVPLFPSFAFAGALFLQLQQLIPSTLQLFFELAGKHGGQASPLSYSYLSPQGWQPLPLLQDATDNFSCSGILQLGIPDNITATNVSMPGNGSWICIAATGNLTGFAETVYCNINGLLAQRSETAYLAEEAPPHIPSNTITKPATAIPALASLIQPFASFGGAAMESIAHMNKRVSLRLHTKDRLVAQGDFYAQLSQQFSFLFHCKVYAPNPSGTALYLVRRVAQDTQPNAYLPYTSACEAQAVQEYVSQRTAPFANCTVQNFTPQYISVYALVTPLRGYSQDALKLAIGQAINLYLSPWINSVQKQTTIDQPLTNTDIAGCIMAVAGVGAVTEVRIKSEEQPPAMPYGAESDFDPVYSVAPISPGYLLVSSLYHTVQFNQAA